MQLELVKSSHSMQMPVRAQARDEMQEANHGKLHRVSKISRGKDHTKPGRTMYEGIHFEQRESRAPMITRRLYGKKYK